MPKNDVLYARNMNLSDSEEDDEDNIWDDGKLNEAYDKALDIANAEVARRIAMTTNSQPGSKSKKQEPAASHSQKKNKTKWKVGMHCRAVYEGDGIEYEAVIKRVINDKECVVCFIGYDNTEIVPLNSLKLSLGQRERNKQMEEALADDLEDQLSNQSQRLEEMECEQRSQSPESIAALKKKKTKKSKQKPANVFNFPDLSTMPMPSMMSPDFAFLKNMSAMDMPIPPPPPMALARHGDSEEQAVSSMLLSWYMSGYYTGLYQGMKRAQESRKHH